MGQKEEGRRNVKRAMKNEEYKMMRRKRGEGRGRKIEKAGKRRGSGKRATPTLSHAR
jgi:hypothetical protein